MKLWLPFFAFVFVFIMAGCHSKPVPAFDATGKWSPDFAFMPADRTPANVALLSQDYILLKKDHTFEMAFVNLRSSGTWSFDGSAVKATAVEVNGYSKSKAPKDLQDNFVTYFDLFQKGRDLRIRQKGRAVYLARISTTNS